MESFEEFVSVKVRRCINQQRKTEIRKRNNLLPRNSNDKRMGNFLRGRKMEVVMQLVSYIICFIAFFPCPTPHFVFVRQLSVLSYLLRNYFPMFSDSSNFSVAIWGCKQKYELWNLLQLFTIWTFIFSILTAYRRLFSRNIKCSLSHYN